MIRSSLALALLAVPALAGDLPRGLGHPAGAQHFYDNNCCSKRDCEPVEPGAIRQTTDGYVIRYLTSRGHVAEGFLRFGATGIRVSRDAKEHACSPQDKVICIYLPMMM
jgi:hypothetical protein